MSDNNLELLKKMYEQGYRCIRTEDINNTMTVYLKNFENEKVDTVSTDKLAEKNQINDYITSMTKE